MAKSPPLNESTPAHAGSVVITGASSGIGRSTATLFARRGWRVGLIARGHVGLEAASEAIRQAGGTAAFAAADVSDAAALEAAASQLEIALGTIDLWINCAGNGTFGRFLDTPAEEFARVTDVTYMGSVNGTRVALRRMLPRDAGCIINVCSAVAFHGMPLLSSYSGAKHALRGFGQAVRAELAQDGSRVRLATVYPPAVNTPFFDHAVSHMRGLGRPMSPVYQPEVVADAIHLVAVSRRVEMPISFTTVMFAAAVRLVPRLVSRAIRRLGYEGQLTEDPAALARHQPTLFAAAASNSPARGGFDALCRRGSVHVSLLRGLARLGARRPATPEQSAGRRVETTAKGVVTFEKTTNPRGESAISRHTTPPTVTRPAAKHFEPAAKDRSVEVVPAFDDRPI